MMSTLHQRMKIGPLSAVVARWTNFRVHRMGSNDKLAVVVLLVLWIGAVVAVNPIGNFPLNDDWSYGRAVRSLVQDGRFSLTDWTSMPLVTQVLWGAMFSRFLGFSYTTLRVSTLVLGAVGVLGTYALFRQAQATAPLAFLGALTIALNPLYFQLSNSFMTDVPYFAVTVVALVLLARAQEADSLWVWVLGIAVAYAAMLIRQIGIVLPAAAGIIFVASHGVHRRIVLSAMLPTLAAFAILFGYHFWLEANNNLPGAYDEQAKTLISALTQPADIILAQLLDNLLIVLVYSGLFLTPLLLIAAPGVWHTLTSKQRILSFVFASGFVTLLMMVLAAQGRWMPLADNLLRDGGLGPLTLRDVYLLGMPHAPSAPLLFRQIVTLIGLSGAALLIQVMVIAAVRQLRATARSLTALALVVSTLYFLPLSPIHFFDRYGLLLLPLFIILVISVIALPPVSVSPRWWMLALSVVVLVGTFTVSATHDYLSWNRVRWTTLQSLVDDAHVPPTEIDGGFEFNMWYLFPQYYRGGWSLYHDQYLIAFGPVDGYEILQQYPVQTWLPFGGVQIVLLTKRN